jgi:hypothetical protein
MKAISIKWFILIVAFLFSNQIIRSQDEKFEALFIYNFTKYIEWPAENQTSEFIITIVGNDDIIPELETICSRMKVNTKTIVVKKINSVSVIPPTQILFLPKDRSDEIGQVLENIKNRNILLITEKPQLCSLGAAINFISKNGNISFEIHKGNIEKFGLKVNSQLFSLGTIVK